MKRRILILGGTGVFGKRLAVHLSQNLAKLPEIEVIITSRRLDRASKAAEALKQNNPDYDVIGFALDHRKGLQQALDDLKPFIVVDCSGPFQSATYDVASHVGLSNFVNFNRDKCRLGCRSGVWCGSASYSSTNH